MKIDTSYDWSFKIKDEGATRNKHASTITRMKEAGVRYDNILDYYFDQELLQQVMFPQTQRGSMWFSSFIQPRVQKEGKLSKSMLRELKTRVNGVAYDLIQRNLEASGYPKSWATAFYMAYYSKINSIMTRVTKEIVRSHL